MASADRLLAAKHTTDAPVPKTRLTDGNKKGKIGFWLTRAVNV